MDVIMKESPGEITEGRNEMTRNAIIREYFRLCELVTDAEEERSYTWTDESGQEQTGSFSLLDADQAQRLREEYHERAEAVLSYYRKEESRGAPLTTL